MLKVDGLVSGYGRLEVLHGVSLDVEEGEFVSLLGANGAGKTTLLRAISGLLPTWRGKIAFDGKSIEGGKPERIAAAGIGHLPEGRGVLQSLTVRENMELGTVVRRGPRRTWPRTASACSGCSRSWPSGCPRPPPRSRAASSRCSRSRAR